MLALRARPRALLFPQGLLGRLQSLSMQLTQQRIAQHPAPVQLAKEGGPAMAAFCDGGPGDRVERGPEVEDSLTQVVELDRAVVGPLGCLNVPAGDQVREQGCQAPTESRSGEQVFLMGAPRSFLRSVSLQASP